MEPTLTTCPYCGTGCVLYLVTDDGGRAVGVEGAAGNVPGNGQLCVKGWNAHSFINHPDRLTTPLVRGGGQPRPAPWA
jgi:predicted molibdopterin-dependent oxidoreductase YjgC